MTQLVRTGDCPRVRRGLAVIPCGDGVVFSGGVWGKKISGNDACRVLLPIARLLDGSRTISEIATRSGFGEKAVRQVIRTLAGQGLLEVADDAAEGTAAAPLVAYLAKTLDPGSARRTVAAALTEMAGARAVVIAPAELTNRICPDLSASGIGTVAYGTDRAAAAPVSGGKAARALALVHDDGSDRAARIISDLVSGDHDSVLPVLRFHIGQSAIEVGPAFYPGCAPAEQACHSCMRTGRRRLGVSDAPITDAAHFMGAADVGCALVVAEALAVLGDLGTVTSFRTLHRLAWPELAAERYVVLPEPGCPACGSMSAPGNAAVGTPDEAHALCDAYEQEVQLWPSFVRKPGTPSVGNQRKLDLLQSMRTAYPGSPRLPLPDDDGVRTAGRSGDDEAGHVTLRAMADLLRRTAGMRRPGQAADLRRWTASGGNLASVELYVISNSALRDWPAGTVFKYDDVSHELIVTTRAPLPAQPVGNGVRPADFTIIFVGAFGRIGYKYGRFSLRLCLLDAGCALAQLNALAAFHGLRMRVSTSWDSAVPAAIELADNREMITAIAELYRNEDLHAAGQ